MSALQKCNDPCAWPSLGPLRPPPSPLPSPLPCQPPTTSHRHSTNTSAHIFGVYVPLSIVAAANDARDKFPAFSAPPLLRWPRSPPHPRLIGAFLLHFLLIFVGCSFCLFSDCCSIHTNTNTQAHSWPNVYLIDIFAA